ncbi:MAG: MFS transporter, partial [Patescibacteria group bacterium]
AFFVALLLNLIVLIIALSKLRGVNHEFKGSLNVDDIFKKIIRRKNVLRIYYISFVLEFFYAIMIIYSPIYLKSLGISWEQIGLIFTVMLIPFIILPYPAGFLADKRFGEKELLIASLFIMVLSTAAILFIDTSDVLHWTIVLFSTRIGAALIQTLRDSYFYKRIDGHDVDLINFFRTSMPTAYILAAVFSFFILSFYPINYVFMMLCALILSALWPAFRLADNKSEKELKSLEYISNQ